MNVLNVLTLTATSVLMLACTALLSPNVSQHSIQCSLTKTESQFAGVCAMPCAVHALAINFDGLRPNFSCNEPSRSIPISLSSVAGNRSWLGEMTGRQPEDPTRFEIIQAGANVAKTPFGWFPLEALEVKDTAMTISIDARKQLRPSADDVKILQSARAMLPNVAQWNKNDDRTCKPEPRVRSVFCALMDSTQIISGGIHYRQPALQAVREVLNAVGGSRVGKHRLMDYNNHPDTTLEEIHKLLSTAEERITREMR
jgi:hypothetical protein